MIRILGSGKAPATEVDPPPTIARNMFAIEVFEHYCHFAFHSFEPSKHTPLSEFKQVEIIRLENSQTVSSHLDALLWTTVDFCRLPL